MKSKQKRFGHAKILCLVLSLLMMVSVMPMGATFASATDGEEVSSEVTLTEESVEPAESTESEEETEESEPDEETEDTTYANSISGVLWIDANEDGTYDAGEQPLADYPVYLYAEDDTDNAVLTVTTDADGVYMFENIEPGNRYIVGIKAEENGTEYLLPLCGVQKDNKFYFTPDYSKVISNPIEIAADTVVEDICAAMRTMPQIQPMANTTYTIDITTQATVTSSITAQSIPGVAIASNVLTFNNTVDPTDTYILTGTTTTVRVVVDSGVTANIALSGASITNAVSLFRLMGTANANLTLSGTNTLTCTGALGVVGNYQAGLYVAPSAALTIEGTGSLDVTGGAYSAGIGGSYMNSTVGNSANSTGTIIINGGTITANSGMYAAGIGGGYYGSGGIVRINGGTVTSISNGTTTGNGAAGIGSGISGGNGGIIEITGGTVTATAPGGAGIGGGYNSAGGTITISGGTVIATGGYYGAGIGGCGNNAGVGSSGTINISGGTVTATATSGVYSTPGIGAGNLASTSGTITISGGRVTATGSLPTAPGIGSYSKTVSRGTVIFTGGSIYPTDKTGNVSVYPAPTNGSNGAPDPVGLITFGGYSSGDAFYLTAGGTVSSYPYNAIAHPDGNVYAWLTYPGVRTDAATAMSTTAASVTAPSTVNSAASSTATLNGSYYLNNTSPVTQARFEWGTTTSYGTTIDMTSSINTTETATAVRTLSPPALTGLTPGTTYHYRLVILTSGITVEGNDVTFTPPALAPSVDVTHDYPGGTTATLEGIYALNGGTFVSGMFEISSDGGSTWSTPTGGALTGSTTTPTVNLTGLTPGTTYHYRLTVINSEGTATTVMKELTVSAKTVTISNTITGAYGDMTKAFTYTIYFQDSAGAPLASGTTFTYTGGVIAGSGATAPSGGTLTLDSAGKATVTLTTGQTITIAGVATSAKVRVVQTTDANYTTSFKDSEDASSTSGADTGVRSMTAADRTFDFTNTRSVVPGGISTGSGGIVLLSLMALALASGLAITAAYRRRAGAR